MLLDLFEFRFSLSCDRLPMLLDLFEFKFYIPINTI